MKVLTKPNILSKSLVSGIRAFFTLFNPQKHPIAFANSKFSSSSKANKKRKNPFQESLNKKTDRTSKEETNQERESQHQQKQYQEQENLNEFDSSIKELKTLLASEIEYENKNYSSISKRNLKNFLTETGFTFYEEEFSSQLILKRDTDKYYISIYFKAREPLNAEGNSFDKVTSEASKASQLIDQSLIEDMKKEEFSAYDFQILVQKKERGLVTSKGFYFICNYAKGSLLIKEMFSGENIVEYQKKISENNPDYNEYYLGERFQDFDVQIRSWFLEFLDELGVNVDLFSVMEVLSLDKDQRLYMAFLKELDKFFV